MVKYKYSIIYCNLNITYVIYNILFITMTSTTSQLPALKSDRPSTGTGTPKSRENTSGIG